MNRQRTPQDPDGDADAVGSDGDGEARVASEGEGSRSEGGGDSAGAMLGSSALRDGGGVASVRPPTRNGTPSSPMSRTAARPRTRRPSIRRRSAASANTRVRTRGETVAVPNSPRNRTLSRRMPVEIERHDRHSARCADELGLFPWREALAELLRCQEDEGLVIRHRSSSVPGDRICRNRTRARQM